MTETEIKKNFAKNVRDLRTEYKLNQVQLGEKIHYSSKAISKWENEDVLPDVVTLNMIANFFNITVDDLISNKNVVRKSHRKLNRILITTSGSLLSFFIGAIAFLILYLCQAPGSWKAFVVAFPCACITFVVFAGIWFKRRILTIAVVSLIWSLALMIMSFMNFDYYWIILIAAGILTILALAFFNIRFSNWKEKDRV